MWYFNCSIKVAGSINFVFININATIIWTVIKYLEFLKYSLLNGSLMA